MHLDYPTLQQLENTYGDSFYILKIDEFEKNYRDFLRAFKKYYSRTTFGYSYKTNYLPAVCKKADELGAYAEIVSEMELAIALKVGVEPHRIIYNGPCKTPESLRFCLLNRAKVNVDNNFELSNIDNIARQNPNKKIKIGVRLNLDLKDKFFSRFGYDTSSDEFKLAHAIISQSPNIQLNGLHFHSSRPDRSTASFVERLERLIVASQTVFQHFDIEYINVGGGFFGRMDESMRSQFDGEIPTSAEYGEALAKTMKSYFPAEEKELIVEPGVALAANIFSYIAKVYDIKSIRGKNIATTSGSYQNVKPSGHKRRLTAHVFRQEDLQDDKDTNVYQLAGYTCMENDYLLNDYVGNLAPGDYLQFDNVGAYSIVFKPPFIKLAPPVLSIEPDGVEEARRVERFEDIFQSYVFDEQS